MKNLFIVLSMFLTIYPAYAGRLVLAHEGKTDYTIVIPDCDAPGDQLILEEFLKHLRLACGADFPVARLAQAPPARRIFLGVAPAGVSLDSWESQEHAVETRGTDLYLYGNGPNGARYAMYDWLQKDLGFRFFDARGGARIPHFDTLAVENPNRRTRFDIALRRTTMYWLFNYPHSTFFLYRNGQNNWMAPTFRNSNIVSTPDDFPHFYPIGHTLPRYLPKDDKTSTYPWIRELDDRLWERHPEYFTMDSRGKRINNHQYCLSNRQLRDLLAERVMRNIELNPECLSFDISAGDTPGRFCHCPDCLALEKKYGTISGPLLDFFLELCPKVAKKYPGKLLSTLIYRKDQTQKPPRNIERMPYNFVPVFAPIDDNFAQDWGHPSNRETYEDLRQWGRLCRNVWVWYYPNPYNGTITPPLGNVGRMVNDIRHMKRAGVTGMVWEHNVGVQEMIGFTEMQSYIALQLFQNVDQDWKKLADEFIAFEYGSAAPLMKSYWQELETLRVQQDGGKLKLSWSPNFSTYTYLTPDRLVRWHGQFQRMEKLVAQDSVRLFNVRRVEINLELAILRKYKLVKRAYPDYGFTMEHLQDRIRDVFLRALDDFYVPLFDFRKKERQQDIKDVLLNAYLQNIGDASALPGEIFGGIPEDRLYICLPTVNGKQFLKNPQAMFGWCAVHDRPEPRTPFRSHFETRDKPRFYSSIGAVSSEKLPPHGTFRFYDLGAVTLTPNCVFRMGVGDWWDFKASLGTVYVPGTYNRVKIYASLQFQGPHFYQKDAGKKNQVLCDCIVVVRQS